MSFCSIHNTALWIRVLQFVSLASRSVTHSEFVNVHVGCCLSISFVVAPNTAFNLCVVFEFPRTNVHAAAVIINFALRPWVTSVWWATVGKWVDPTSP
jgi:hypothetical protein